MDNVDLNFLSEHEIEAIVNVIEKDFELKAAEKSRLCRLRKNLIKSDQRATEVSQTMFDGQCCVICFKRFILLFNPRRVCCSCGLQICGSCCKYVKDFENYVCRICQQQKDIIAMNCSWFYENIRRKFMDGGSQIVANSLSEYPKKNLISPTILNMVRGTQITKFRHQVEEASRTIEESLIKVELSFTDRATKSIKYTELIQKFVDKLKQIIRNTSQVLFITMENYFNKIGQKKANIDIEVMNTLHEEVELLIGRKIDIKNLTRNLLNGRKALEDLDGRENLETLLSTPIVDKLLYDVQQSLLESRGKKYDDLNYTLQSMVRKASYDTPDFDFESVSQAPSRHSTIRRTDQLIVPRRTSFEASKSASLDSLHSSRLYSLSELGRKSQSISKQWHELMSNDAPDAIHRDSLYPLVERAYDDMMVTDSDALSMHNVNEASDSNWLMQARNPIGSLSSLFVESNDPYEMGYVRKSDSSQNKNMTQYRSLDDDLDEMCEENKSMVSDLHNLSIEKEFRRNMSIIGSVPNLSGGHYYNESGGSQDSGIATGVKVQQNEKPVVPSRRRSKGSSFRSEIQGAPEVPKRKPSLKKKIIEQSPKRDSGSDVSGSDIDNNGMRKMVIIKAKKK